MSKMAGLRPEHFLWEVKDRIATVRSLCQGTTFRSGRLAQMFL